MWGCGWWSLTTLWPLPEILRVHGRADEASQESWRAMLLAVFPDL